MEEHDFTKQVLTVLRDFLDRQGIDPFEGEVVCLTVQGRILTRVRGPIGGELREHEDGFASTEEAVAAYARRATILVARGFDQPAPGRFERYALGAMMRVARIELWDLAQREGVLPTGGPAWSTTRNALRLLAAAHRELGLPFAAAVDLGFEVAAPRTWAILANWFSAWRAGTERAPGANDWHAFHRNLFAPFARLLRRDIDAGRRELPDGMTYSELECAAGRPGPSAVQRAGTRRVRWIFLDRIGIHWRP